MASTASNAARRRAGDGGEQGQILPRVMQDLERVRVGEQFGQGRARRRRVGHPRRAVGRGELHDAEPGKVGARPDELGVQGREPLGAQPRDDGNQIRVRFDDHAVFRRRAGPGA